MNMKRYDYIIVGAGSAGCVMANRLSADPNVNVLLVEFGGGDNSIFIQMPSALSIPLNSDKYDWRFFSQPEPHLDNRRLHQPRGKVIGGSSSTNGMVFVRGNPEDFNQWQTNGANGWRYADVLPYFKKMETYAQGGDPNYRGQTGPLHVTQGKRYSPLYDAFIEAGAASGIAPKIDDYNGATQEGFFYKQMTVKQGKRCSTAAAYIKPILHRANLHVRLHTFISRVLLENGRATGIEILRNGRQEQLFADREVILCAGSIMSPKLLMLSGIGEAEHLREMGIPTVHHSPGVGQNLQDHLELYQQFACKKPVSLYPYMNWAGKALIGARWLLRKDWLGATNHFEAGAFIRSSQAKWANIQFHFLPVAISYDGKTMPQCHSCQVHVGPTRSPSRGTIRLASHDPLAKPIIHFNYMSHDSDWQEFREAIRATRDIFNQAPLQEFVNTELFPGKNCHSDNGLNTFIRTNVESAIHASCTCKMGNDEMAVVDEQGRVYGVEALRVVDSSIFPTIPNGNLNAPTIMVAEKIAAEMIM